jgi:hypothetical protein
MNLTISRVESITSDFYSETGKVELRTLYVNTDDGTQFQINLFADAGKIRNLIIEGPESND